MRIAEIVVVYDVACPSCSRIARELPDVVRVRVTVRSCRDPKLALAYPTVPATVRACARPAIATRRRDGTVRWWPGPAGVLAVLPAVRLSGIPAAAGLLWTALRASART